VKKQFCIHYTVKRKVFVEAVSAEEARREADHYFLEVKGDVEVDRVEETGADHDTKIAT